MFQLRGAIQGLDENRGAVSRHFFSYQREVSGEWIWKRTNHSYLLIIVCFNFVITLAIDMEEGYFFLRRSCLCSSQEAVAERGSGLLSFVQIARPMENKSDAKGVCGEGDTQGVVSTGEEMESAAVVRTRVTARGDDPLLGRTVAEHKGKLAMRRFRGEAPPLVIDMEAARRAVFGFLVVGRFLAPF